MNFPETKKYSKGFESHYSPCEKHISFTFRRVRHHGRSREDQNTAPDSAICSQKIIKRSQKVAIINPYLSVSILACRIFEMF